MTNEQEEQMLSAIRDSVDNPEFISVEKHKRVIAEVIEQQDDNCW